MDKLAMMDEMLGVAEGLMSKAKLVGDDDMRWTAGLMQMYLRSIMRTQVALDEGCESELELVYENLQNKAVWEDDYELYTQVVNHLMWIDMRVAEMEEEAA